MTTQTQETGKEVAKAEPKSLKGMLADVRYKQRFEEILGKKAPAFISSIISAVQANDALQKCEPGSVVGAAVIAASLDLPINSSLGQAHIVPYSNVAQFQMGWKGYVQLGQRTGQYKTMHATPVYEGELLSNDRITGDMKFDQGAKKSEKIIGYLFYFKLVSGFEKFTYMTVEEVHAHGKKYSKSYSNPKGKWQQDFHSMALKTVVKMGLSKWGPLSTEMQKAVAYDQAAVKEDGTPEYIDSTVVREGDETPAEKPEMPKPTVAASSTPSEPSTAQDVVLPGGSYSVTKAAKTGCRVVSRNGVIYTNDHEGVSKLAFDAMVAGHGLKLTFWPGTTENEIESAEVVKA